MDNFGLMFYNARWYDPALGRFTSADTVGSGDRYAYVGNNPVNLVDPSGHAGKCRDEWSDYQCKQRLPKQEGPSSGGSVGNPSLPPEGAGFDPTIIQAPGLSLNFSGYSELEQQILRLLYNSGGPDAIHGVEYILSKQIHISWGSTLDPRGGFGSRGAWFDDSNVYLSPQVDKSTVLKDYFALQNIIHEALHIEQGFALSHSWEGERLAWQAGARVYNAFGQHDERFDHIQGVEDPVSFAASVLKDDPVYAIPMIIFYPVRPGQIFPTGPTGIGY